MKRLDIPSLKFLKVGVDTDPLNNHNLEYLEKQNAIAALILNYSGDKVLFVNQYRAGVHNYIYEVPAGLIENNEEPIVALEREVREETGYKREDYDILYDSNTGFLVSPGYTTEKIYIYIIKLKFYCYNSKTARLICFVYWRNCLLKKMDYKRWVDKTIYVL